MPCLCQEQCWWVTSVEEIPRKIHNILCRLYALKLILTVSATMLISPRNIAIMICNKLRYSLYVFICIEPYLINSSHCVSVLYVTDTGPRLNIKTVLSTYGDFHVKDKTAVRTSYLNMGIAIPGKTVFLIETAPRSSLVWAVAGRLLGAMSVLGPMPTKFPFLWNRYQWIYLTFCIHSMPWNWYCLSQ